MEHGDWISTTMPSGFSHLQLIKIPSLFSAHHHERLAPFPKISPVSLWRLWGLQIDFCSDFPAGIYSGLLLLKKQNKTKTTCFFPKNSTFSIWNPAINIWTFLKLKSSLVKCALLSQFLKHPRSKFAPMEACFMETGVRRRWSRIP